MMLLALLELLSNYTGRSVGMISEIVGHSLSPCWKLKGQGYLIIIIHRCLKNSGLSPTFRTCGSRTVTKALGKKKREKMSLV